MREVVLEIPRLAVEPVLDRLLPIVPSGIREVQKGRHVELRMRGANIPTPSEIAVAAGRWPHKLSEREVPDDWRQRRLQDYEADPIGGRLVVRPEWAPMSTAAIDIVVLDAPAFGAGRHPTTRTCLELLLELEPAGGFADLGCGTGVLAILAAKLGWSPVVAVDVSPSSIAATRANADHNSTAVNARVLDLCADPAPAADAFAANVPPVVHLALLEGWAEEPPPTGLLSGFGTAEADEVLRAYAARGLRTRRRLESQGWVVAVVARG